MIPFAVLPYIASIAIHVPRGDYARIVGLMTDAGWRIDYCGHDESGHDLITFRRSKP